MACTPLAPDARPEAMPDADGRLAPISRVFGEDRGTGIDRYYIERFLAQHAPAVHGRVLEFADRRYTERFGGDRVETSDVLHLTDDNPKATIVADLTAPNDIPADRFDCILCTQTLPFLFDVRAAVRCLHRILRPGGTLLVTVPGISQISRYDADRWGDYWRFTVQCMETLLGEAFSPTDVAVQAYGNVRVAAAFLDGRAAEELAASVLEPHDRDYQLLITAVAVKAKAYA